MDNQRTRQLKLLCRCGDDQLKSLKQRRGYFNPHCKQCNKRKDCYFCASCAIKDTANKAANTQTSVPFSLCQDCSVQNGIILSQLLSQCKTFNSDTTKNDGYQLIITSLLTSFPNIDKNSQFEQIILNILLSNNTSIISYFHDQMDEIATKNTQYAYINYLCNNITMLIGIFGNSSLIVLRLCLSFITANVQQVFENRAQPMDRSGIINQIDAFLAIVKYCLSFVCF